MQNCINSAHDTSANISLVPPIPSLETWLANYLAVQAFIDGDVGLSLSQIKSLPMFCDMPSAVFARLIDGLTANGGVRLVRCQFDTVLIVEGSFVEQQMQRLAKQLANADQRLNGESRLSILSTSN